MQKRTIDQLWDDLEPNQGEPKIALTINPDTKELEEHQIRPDGHLDNCLKHDCTCGHKSQAITSKDHQNRFFHVWIRTGPDTYQRQERTFEKRSSANKWAKAQMRQNEWVQTEGLYVGMSLHTVIECDNLFCVACQAKQAELEQQEAALEEEAWPQS